MDQQSYQDGKSGNAIGPNTDINAYRVGQAEREGTTYNPTSETGEKQATTGGWSAANNPNYIGGAFFGIMLVSPYMVMVYPAGGAIFLGLLAACVALMRILHVHDFTMMFIIFVFGIIAFYTGVIAEKKISQIGFYRGFRQFWRIIVAGMLLIGCVLKGGSRPGSFSFDINLAIQNGDQIVVSLLGMTAFIVFAFWMAGKSDRGFFTVESLQKQEAERQITAAPIKSKGKSRRVMIAIAWFIPATLAAHLIIRLSVDAYFKLMTPESDMETLRLAFYKKNLIFIFIADFAVWLLLSIKGLLPGMKK